MRGGRETRGRRAHASSSDAGDAIVRAAFLDRLNRDLDEGAPRRLEEYQEMFPDHDGLIAEELERVRPRGGAGEDPRREDASEPASLESIGPFRILRLIDQGGMGAVYLAEQDDPRRQVAIKVIKLGLDTHEVLRRFRGERRALASMSHDAIAKVYDAGVTATGQPFFTMEYVPGEPLAAYCDRRRMPLRDRVELLRKVCAGVEHAHQKAILHRDLKPGNILVTEQDGCAVPKIIDFGLAKSLERRADWSEAVTEGPHRALGTPLYMSPEQAAGSPAIDTRTDVYSLGVILHELLVGGVPGPAGGDGRSADSGSPLASYRRSAGDAEAARSIADARRLSADALDKRVRGDLDWICRKALEADPTRRYGSAAALSSDLERYLSHEPVHAGPPSRGYRAKKFLRRHRVAVGVGTTFLALLLVGGLVSSIGFLQARTANRSLRDQIANTNDLVDFLPILHLLAQAEGGGYRSLDSIEDRVEAAFGSRPLLEAKVQSAIGIVLMYQGRDQEAEALLTTAVDTLTASGSDSHDAVEALFSLSNLYTDQGQWDLSENVSRRALAMSERLSGEDGDLAARAQLAFGNFLVAQDRLPEAIEFLTDALARLRELHGEHDEHTLMAKSHLALALLRVGRLAEAEGLIEESEEWSRSVFGEKSPQYSFALRTLGLLRHAQGRFDLAEDCLQRCLEVQNEMLGPRSTHTMTTMNHLGDTWIKLRRYDEAEEILQKSLELRRRELGDHPHVMLSLNSLASVMQAKGNALAEEKLYREALDLSDRILGRRHRNTLIVLTNLASLQLDIGKLSEAETNARDAVAGFVEECGERDRATIHAINVLALVLQASGRTEEAEPTLRRLVQLLSDEQGADDPTTQATTCSLIRVLARDSDLSEALAALDEAIARLERVDAPGVAQGFLVNGLGLESDELGANSSSANAFRVALGRYLLDQGSAREGARLLRKALRVAKSSGDERTAGLVQSRLEAIE